MSNELIDIYLVLGDEGGTIAAFSTMDAARESFPDGEIEVRRVHQDALPPWTYWHHGADVYPDGSYDEWEKELPSRGEVFMSACDDHLNDRTEPWDGHTQDHCGEHISIFGTDRELVGTAFKKHLAEAIARQNGKCQSKYAVHRNGVDGITTYNQGWYKPPRVRREAGEKP